MRQFYKIRTEPLLVPPCFLSICGTTPMSLQSQCESLCSSPQRSSDSICRVTPTSATFILHTFMLLFCTLLYCTFFSTSVTYFKIEIKLWHTVNILFWIMYTPTVCLYMLCFFVYICVHYYVYVVYVAC